MPDSVNLFHFPHVCFIIIWWRDFKIYLVLFCFVPWPKGWGMQGLREGGHGGQWPRGPWASGCPWHWQNSLWKTQARSQDFAKGKKGFLEAGNNSKRTWPKFSSVLNEIEAVFLSKSGDLQKNKKVITNSGTVFPAEIRCSPKKKSSPKFMCAPEETTPLFWSK